MEVTKTISELGVPDAEVPTPPPQPCGPTFGRPRGGRLRVDAGSNVGEASTLNRQQWDLPQQYACTPPCWRLVQPPRA